MGIIKMFWRFFKSIHLLYQRMYLRIQLKLNKVTHTDLPIIAGKIFLRNNGKLILGENIRLNSSLNSTPIGGDTIVKLVVTHNAKLTIGDNAGISGSAIYCTQEINIGKHVFVGGSCKIYDTDFHALDPYVRTGGKDNQTKSAPVNIGDYAFIGGSSIVLKGISIGEKSIVGAGSVVTKNIPPNEIWGGNPAKFIRKI